MIVGNNIAVVLDNYSRTYAFPGHIFRIFKEPSEIVVKKITEHIVGILIFSVGIILDVPLRTRADMHHRWHHFFSSYGKIYRTFSFDTMASMDPCSRIGSGTYLLLI